MINISKSMPDLICKASDSINANAQEVTELDLAIGDGDHVINLQRGLQALIELSPELKELDWVSATQKIGMSLMSNVGGASGSLFGTLFIHMSKVCKDNTLNQENFAEIFYQAVEAVKARGKAQAGEKTMLDVLIPVAECLKQASHDRIELSETLNKIKQVAISGMEATKDMIATKGRASYQGEKSLGHIDAGAKTCQLMICAIADELLANLKHNIQIMHP